MMKNVKDLLRNPMRFEKALYIVASVCCIGAECVEWVNSVGLTPLMHVQNALMIMLLALLPLWPLQMSLGIAALCPVLYAVSADSYWLVCNPFLLAVILLGRRWGRYASALPAVLLTQILSLVGTLLANEPLRGITFMLEPMAISWLIGTLMRYAAQAQGEQVAAEQRVRHRESQLKMLHVLHDSVANDLVYAVSRSRSLATRLRSRNEIEDLEEIIGVLESALMEIRQQIIMPVRDQLDEHPTIGDVRSNDAGSDADAPPEFGRNLTLIKRRLDKQGFYGTPQVVGDPTRIDGRTARILNLCIREIGGNIAKYGRPGEYALVVSIADDGTTVISSNTCRDAGPANGVENAGITSSGSGLTMLRGELHDAGGTISTGKEDGEWSVYVFIPRQTAPGDSGHEPNHGHDNGENS
ncbi:hypothetical protein JS528_00075 [Bifidobacterium sp. MA2]|uniref:Histidine kinase n=1 Tax=Bifidobacterium santillanense TaxID=2809028 RepID=A0ABS5ULI1_9BIFI|nr:hypothetical protein [Bifidobacterium santillanense]MBT1171781.1 hypothetical protein [Bifidobacterium santillanense]